LKASLRAGIRASVPTIKYLLDKGAKVAISSHLGRPKVWRKMQSDCV